MAMLGLDEQNQASLLKVVILGLIGTMAIASRLFSVIRFESVIHEFDPWFNYRTTRQLVANGFYEFWNWFDERSWYPLGRVVGGTVFPGIMTTSAIIYNVLHALNFTVDIRNVCVFLAPLFSSFTAVAAYLLTSEIKNPSAGLLAAAFIGIAPGYISRSVAGSYDNECIAIFILMFTFYLWIKSLKEGSAFYGGMTALFYFYMVAAWGGYVFIINLIPLHVFVLVLMGRFSSRLYVAYSSFYVLGTFMSMNIPFIGFQPSRTSEHMAAMGIFGLLQIIAFVELVRSHVPSNQFQILFRSFVVVSFVAMFAAMVVLTLMGYIAPWTGRFYSLWDTGYARKHLPIIASVSEHQPTAWPSFFFDLEMMVFLFPAGVYLCFQELRDEHVFVILYGVTASYFAGVMVRLMLTLTPVVCIASAITVSKLLDIYLDLSTLEESEDEEPQQERQQQQQRQQHRQKSEKASSNKTSDKKSTSQQKQSDKASEKKASKKRASYFGIWSIDTRLLVLANFLFFLIIFVWHCTWVTSHAYSSPSIVLATKGAYGEQVIIDDFREAYYWLRRNTDYNAKILSWWDYGYQIAGMADRTVLVDNNTWNNTHIATVGRALASNEESAYEIMRRHDVDYALVIFGGLLGYSGDDINKFLWMVRIAQGVFPNDVKESDYYTARGEYRIDADASQTMRDSIMFKMSYHNFNELFGGVGHDRVRHTKMPAGKVRLDIMDEAFTSENWIVRIYKVKQPDNLGRSHRRAVDFDVGRKTQRVS